MDKDMWKYMAQSPMMASLLNSGGLSAATALNPYAALIASAPALMQAGIGLGQTIQGNKMSKANKRPLYSIPAAQLEALGKARNMAAGDMPGYAQTVAQMDANTAAAADAALRSGGGSTDRMGAALQLNRNATQNARALGAQNADNRYRANLALMNELGTMAGFQDKKWEINDWKKFQDAQAAANRLKESGKQNLYLGTKELAGNAVRTIGYKKDGTSTNPYAMPTFDPKAPGSEDGYDWNSLGSGTTNTMTPYGGANPYSSTLRGIGSYLTPDTGSVNTNGGGTPDLTQLGIGGAYDIVPPKGPYPIGYDANNQRMMPKPGTPEYDLLMKLAQQMRVK